MNTTSFKTVNEFLYQTDKTFVVPNYQRGYKWAVQDIDDDGKKISHVEKLCADLLNAYKDFETSKQPYFLQGITVSEVDKKIILIDGQQRTTTLYLLLWCLSKDNIKDIDLKYDIRTESKNFINSLKTLDEYPNNDTDEKYQDIHYFKEAIKQIQEKIDGMDRDSFKDFILNSVQIIYIEIDEKKAVQTFTMMNGSKATMLHEELVKAEMLRKISLPDIQEKEVSTSVEANLAELKEIIAKDWNTNALRSRYAREWDKWLYWWNKPEVQKFFGVENPMGLLIEYHQKLESQKENFNFANFKKLLSKEQQTKEQKTEKQQTKEQFRKLRDLQKSFEDIFNKPKIHNYLGMSLIDAESNKFDIINYFIENKKNDEILAIYAKWRMVGATHTSIITTKDQLSQNVIAKEDCAQDVLTHLADNFVYGQYNTDAFKQLLRLNVEEDNKLNRLFDFTIWQNKSLEHIYPKSRVYHSQKEDGKIWYKGDDNPLLTNEKQEIISELNKIRKKKESEANRVWLNRASFKGSGSEHCIGNLVLLYGSNNSEFGNMPVKEKKKRYFNTSKEKPFLSRHLLHSVSVFAEENWREKQIQENKERFLTRFKEDYKL
jgi:hypothetical protein